jgi:hypothetical protein
VHREGSLVDCKECVFKIIVRGIDGNHAATPISRPLPFNVHLFFCCFSVFGRGATTGGTAAVSGGEELIGASPSFRVVPLCNCSKMSF